MNDININSMNPKAPKWKQALKWFALALASLITLDWLLDGRLRNRLPLRRNDRTHNPNP